MKFMWQLLLFPIFLVRKIKRDVHRLYKLYIEKDEFTVEVSRWFRDNGDENLRIDYPDLNENSIVFDLGGYMGDFAQAIHDKYRCNVYVFEPHPQFYDVCVKRFLSYEKIVPFNYGLSDKDGKFLLSDSVDGSSFLNPNHGDKDGVVCEMREILSVLKELDISNIDLMKINIEGGEYPILLHMISENKLSLVNNFQIQFHNFIEGADCLRSEIIAALLKTHVQTWCYTFVWENWKRK